MIHHTFSAITFTTIAMYRSVRFIRTKRFRHTAVVWTDGFNVILLNIDCVLR